MVLLFFLSLTEFMQFHPKHQKVKKRKEETSFRQRNKSVIKQLKGIETYRNRTIEDESVSFENLPTLENVLKFEQNCFVNIVFTFAINQVKHPELETFLGPRELSTF